MRLRWSLAAAVARRLHSGSSGTHSISFVHVIPNKTKIPSYIRYLIPQFHSWQKYTSSEKHKGRLLTWFIRSFFFSANSIKTWVNRTKLTQLCKLMAIAAGRRRRRSLQLSPDGACECVRELFGLAYNCNWIFLFPYWATYCVCRTRRRWQ